MSGVQVYWLDQEFDTIKVVEYFDYLELLEALEAIYEMCDGYVPNTSKAKWNAARLVIAKAKGAS